VLVILAITYGGLRLWQFATPGDASLTVTIVQGGLHSGRDDLETANAEAWATYSTLSTQDSALKTDLFVWPETVLRVYLRQDDAYRARLLDFVQRLGRPLFVGSLDQPADSSGEFNSGYLINPTQNSGLSTQDLSTAQIYHKLSLLPFGEYVPGAQLVPFLRRWQTTGRFIPGTAASPIRLNPVVRGGETVRTEGAPPRPTTVDFAPSICFEAMRPGAFNQLVRDGAAFLVNLTDDGWFGDTAGPYQHLQAATLRAVETRRWLVRASNSGVSAFVDPTGQVVASLPLGAVGALRHGLTPARTSCLYVRYGNWPLALSAIVVLTAFLERLRQAARRAAPRPG